MQNRIENATKLREARRHRGLTQLQLAATAGVSLTTLSLAERFGLSSEMTATKLARALGIAVEDLVALKSPDAPSPEAA